MKPFRVLIGGAVAAMVSTAAFAAEHTLTISSWAPPGHGMNASMWPNLISMIEDATDGKVTAEIKYRLAPPPAQMDLVQDGAAATYSVVWLNQLRALALLGAWEGSEEAAQVLAEVEQCRALRKNARMRQLRRVSQLLRRLDVDAVREAVQQTMAYA